MSEKGWLSESWKAMFPGEDRFNDLLVAKGDGFIVTTRNPEIFEMIVNGDLPFAPTMYPEGFHAVTRDGLTHISTEEDYLRLYDEDFRMPGWIDHTADWVGETYDWFNGKDPAAWEEGQLDDMYVIARDGFVISTRDADLMKMVIDEVFPMTPTQFPDPFKAVTRDGITQVSTEQDYLDGVEKGKPYYVPPKETSKPKIPIPQKKPEPPEPSQPQKQQKPPVIDPNAETRYAGTITTDKEKSVATKVDKNLHKALSVPNNGDTYTYKVAGVEYKDVTEEVHTALKETAAETGMPLVVMQAVAARESSLIADNVNSSSQACGLFQFMTNYPWTLYEVVGRFGAKHGYEQEAGMVERVQYTDKKGIERTKYEPINKDAEAHLIEMCLNPKFNALMYAEYKLPKIEPHETWLGRPITGGEFALINNYGAKGARLFQQQVWDDKASGTDTKAVDFFKEHKNIFGDVSGNRTTLYHDDGSPKTMRESYAGIMKFGGYGEVKIEEPKPTEIASNNIP